MTDLQQRPTMADMTAVVAIPEAPSVTAESKPTRPRWQIVLPWGFAIVFFLAFAASLRLPPPAAQVNQPAPVESTATMPAQPTISTDSSDGIGRGVTVWRNASGEIIGVMDSVEPYGEQAAWCELTVGGDKVRDEQTDGRPAVCVWVRDAA